MEPLRPHDPQETMSYLPSSRLYEREPEAKPAPAAAAPAPVISRPAPAPKPLPVPPPAPLSPAPAAPKLVAPAPPVLFGSKEWLVAPPPALRVELPEPEPVSPPRRETVRETVTVPSASLPPERTVETTGRKRNIFHNAQKVVLRHLDRAKNRKPEDKDPDLLWFVVMVTGSLCMGLMIWGAYSALPRFGDSHIPLRAGGSSSRLKVSSDVPVRWVRETGSVHPQPQHPPMIHVAPPLTPPVEQQPIVHHAPPPVHEPRIHDNLPDPVYHPRPVMEKPLDPLPERKDPSIFVHANLGETPMIRTWKKLAETSFLLAAFSSAPVNNLLGQIPQQVQVDYSKQINELTKAVQSLTEQVNGIKIDDKLNAVKIDLNDRISKIKIDAPRVDNSNEFLLLANRLEQMEKLIVQIMKNPVAAAPAPNTPAPAVANLDEIKMKLGNIEQAILKLQPSEKRIALAAPTPEPAVVNKPSTSNVVFVNLYNQDLWIWVNQKAHRAPPNTTVTLDNIPAGPATIEVRSPEGVFHKSSPTLVASETFTLTAR